jgi:excisionase family DNA binding protein
MQNRRTADPLHKAAPAAPLLTASQVAQRCQMSLRTVRRWIADGDLPVHRLGRVIRIAEADLDRFLHRARR